LKRAPLAGCACGGAGRTELAASELPLAKNDEVYSVQFDPKTLRGADLTVHPVRYGKKIEGF
jgi:hypothetical protein